jgi:predicted RNA-binding Zn-ribbon protein involved in translation (DUF1610 family)
MSMLSVLMYITGIIIILFVATYGINFWERFCKRKCPYCGKTMHYKGLRYDNDHEENDRYIFHCPHCGAWEEVKVNEV